MKARFVIIFSVLSLSVATGAHPIHVSIVNLDCVPDSNRIDMSVRLYYDDFQLLINHKYNLSLDFSKRTRLITNEQQAITDYINTALVLLDQNENTIAKDFKGWKVEDMSVWLYFCAKLAPEFNLTRLKNTLMLDVFYDQKNLVIVKIENIEKGYEYDKRITNQPMTQ
jgi:hypothetical protein